MAIEEKTQVTFEVVCDRCGALATVALTAQQAVDNAFLDGFARLKRRVSGEIVTRDFCLDCEETRDPEEWKGWKSVMGEM